MEARQPNTVFEGDDELEQVVARIRARGGQELPAPPQDAIAAVIAHLRDEELMSADELDEHERMWRAVEEEMRTIEQANDRAERLL